jgi:hypothetical protein
MRTRVWVALVLLVASAGLAVRGGAPLSASQDARRAPTATPRAGAPRPRLFFAENAGQMTGDVAFAARGRDRDILLGERSMTLVVRDATRCTAVEIAFDGARAVHPRGDAQGRAKLHYFRGAGGAANPLHARTFARVAYDEPWPGVGLSFDARRDAVEYSLVVRPGADAGAARFAVRGAERVESTASGELAVTTALGTVTQSRPVAWQDRDGARVPVDVAFDVSPRGDDGTFTYAFALGAHDPTLAVTIDPEITVQTISWGGSGWDRIAGLAVDPAGGIYVAGSTVSTDLIPPGTTTIDAQYSGDTEAFVAKFDAAGEMAFASYLGESSGGQDVGVDANGRCVVAGYTKSPATFPVLAGPRVTVNTSQNGEQFVARLAADGASLVYAGFLAATYAGYVSEMHVAVNASGFACVAGTETGGLTQVTTTLGDAALHRNAFAIGIEPEGGMRYAVVLAAKYSAYARDVAVDAPGAAYLVGNAGEGTLAPAAVATLTSGAGSYSGYLAKLNPAGTALEYVAYLPGGAYGVDADAQGHAYIVGSSQVDDATFPLVVGPPRDPDEPTRTDGFVAKLSPDGSQFDYCGHLGIRFPTVVVVDANGAVYASGGGNYGTSGGDKIVGVDAEGREAATVASAAHATYAMALDRSTGDLVVIDADPYTLDDSVISRLSGIVPPVPAPFELAAEPLSTTSVRLSWRFTGPVTSFVIERALGSGAFEVIEEIGGGARTIDDLGLTPNTLYRYRLRARAGDVLSKPSLPVFVKTFSTLQIRVRRASVLDTTRPEGDSIALRARLTFPPAFVHGPFDPYTDALHVDVGAATGFALDIPAGDPGWTVSGAKAVWQGTIGVAGTARVVVNIATRRLAVRVGGVTLAGLPANPVVTTLALGDQSATDSRAWRLSRRARVRFP